jgi:hypothetical protein
MDGDREFHNVVIVVVIFQVELQLYFFFIEADEDEFLGLEIEDAVYLINFGS